MINDGENDSVVTDDTCQIHPTVERLCLYR
jgi:hypothetical protein